MSTEFYAYQRSTEGRVIGTRQIRAYKQKAFVWSIPPHEFMELAKTQPSIYDEYGVRYPFVVFIDDVVKPCTIHELESGDV